VGYRDDGRLLGGGTEVDDLGAQLADYERFLSSGKIGKCLAG
jgi:hypothetical protein